MSKFNFDKKNGSHVSEDGMFTIRKEGGSYVLLNLNGEVLFTGKKFGDAKAQAQDIASHYAPVVEQEQETAPVVEQEQETAPVVEQEQETAPHILDWQEGESEDGESHRVTRWMEDRGDYLVGMLDYADRREYVAYRAHPVKGTISIPLEVDDKMRSKRYTNAESAFSACVEHARGVHGHVVSNHDVRIAQIPERGVKAKNDEGGSKSETCCKDHPLCSCHTGISRRGKYRRVINVLPGQRSPFTGERLVGKGERKRGKGNEDAWGSREGSSDAIVNRILVESDTPLTFRDLMERGNLTRGQVRYLWMQHLLKTGMIHETRVGRTCYWKVSEEGKSLWMS